MRHFRLLAMIGALGPIFGVACSSSPPDLCEQAQTAFWNLADSGSSQCAPLAAAGFDKAQCEKNLSSCTTADQGAVEAFLSCVNQATSAPNGGCQASDVVSCDTEQLDDAGLPCQEAIVGGGNG